MSRPVPLLILLALLVSLTLATHGALARCFGVPEGPTELGAGWRVHLTAEAAGIEDGVDLGVFEGASINFEPGLDAIETFPPGKPFYLYFLVPFPDTGFNFFDTHIIRPANRLFWPLTLEVRAEETLLVTVSWSQEDMANVTSEWALTFVDPDREKADMRLVNAVTFTVGNGVHDLRIDASRSVAPLGSTELIIIALAAYGAATAGFLLLRRRRRRK